MKKEFNLYFNGINKRGIRLNKVFKNIPCESLKFEDNIDFINKEQKLFIEENNINTSNFTIIYGTDKDSGYAYDGRMLELFSIVKVLYSDPIIIRAKIGDHYSGNFIVGDIIECVDGIERIPKYITEDYHLLDKVSKTLLCLIDGILISHPELEELSHNHDNVFINWEYIKPSMSGIHDFNKDIPLSTIMKF